MAASKSIHEALNTLNDEPLTAKLTAVAFNNSHALTSRLRRLLSTIRMLGSSWWWRSTILERRPKRWEVLLRQKALPVLKTWKTSPGRSKPGAGDPQ
jgi:hypothetical protein